jgi:hypothetical protein
MTVLRARPQRLRRICWLAAAVVIVCFVALAVSLRGPTGGGGSFRAGDRSAVVGVGILIAIGVLMLSRPRVEADEQHIHVRNVIGSYDLSWDLVRAVGFTKKSPWASLDLADDERISVMAVQAMDNEYALEAMTALRRLHTQSQRPDGNAAGNR